MLAASEITTWIWWTGGGIVAFTGLILAYWSLFYNRSRGKRRCPKCWYDMSYTDGNTCSECGKTQNREKRFLKTRRRWAWSFVAVLLMSIGSIGTQWPRIEASGWRSLVPTTVLIAAVPWFKTSTIRSSKAIPLLGGIPILGAIFKTQEQEFHQILVGRSENNNLWKWQQDWLISKALQGDSKRIPKTNAWIKHYGPFIEHAVEDNYFNSPELQKKLVAVSLDVKLYPPSKWLRGRAAYGSVSLTSQFKHEPLRLIMKLNKSDDYVDCNYFSHAEKHYFEMSGLLNGLPRGVNDLTIKWSFELLGINDNPESNPVKLNDKNIVLSGVKHIDILIVDKVSEYLVPLQNKRLNEKFADSIVSLALKEPPFLNLRYPRLAGVVDFIFYGDIAIGADVEILMDNTVIASTHVTWHAAIINNFLYFLSFLVEPADELTILSDIKGSQDKNELQQYSVRFTSNPSLLNRDWILLCDKYWVGEFTVPLVFED